MLCEGWVGGVTILSRNITDLEFNVWTWYSCRYKTELSRDSYKGPDKRKQESSPCVLEWPRIVSDVNRRRWREGIKKTLVQVTMETIANKKLHPISVEEEQKSIQKHSITYNFCVWFCLNCIVNCVHPGNRYVLSTNLNGFHPCQYQNHWGRFYSQSPHPRASKSESWWRVHLPDLL